MRGKPLWKLAVLTVLAAASGCMLRSSSCWEPNNLGEFHTVATKIEYADINACCDVNIDELAPHTIHHNPQAYWDIRLPETVAIALANSDVLRDLGGTVVGSTDAVGTRHDPAIRETDPRSGVAAALSDFDANLFTQFLFDENDRRANNTFLGDLGFVTQDFGVWDSRLVKHTATGSQFSLRHNIEYDRNNSIGNEFLNGAYTVHVDTEMRHPLLQGGGLLFNRVAGPGADPGDTTACSSLASAPISVLRNLRSGCGIS